MRVLEWIHVSDNVQIHVSTDDAALEGPRGVRERGFKAVILSSFCM